MPKEYENGVWKFEWEELVTYKHVVVAPTKEEAKSKFLSFLKSNKRKYVADSRMGHLVEITDPEGKIDDTWEVGDASGN